MNFESVFFSILSSSLWGTSVEVPQGFNEWGKVFALAKSQAVLGLVANYVLSDVEIAQRIPGDAQKRLKAFMMANVMTHSGLNNTLIRVVSLLNEAGIRSVVLKGQGLARYYPVPELRQCGDIDLYVDEENYEKSYDAIAQIASKIASREVIWDRMHYDAKIGHVMVEVHHKADEIYSRRGAKLYKEIMAAGLSKDLCPQRFGEIDVMTPNDTYNAFYIFGHLWRHFSSSGVGLRQFCDWACFLHTHVGNLDLPYLKRMLEDLDFMKPWQVLGCFLVTELGLPEEEFPFYNKKYVSKVDTVREYVMTDGNFGVNILAGQEKRRGYLHGKWVTVKYYLLRFFRMFGIFPKHTMFRLWYMLRDGFAQVVKDMRKRK